jgi:hypothetical protein
MSDNAKKEINEIIRKLKAHGVEVEQLRNGHWRTKTTPPVTMSFSPSDTNAAHAARRDLRRLLGIDLRAPQKKKGSTHDFAMQRLHARALAQMERGASIADLARMAVYESEAKRIGGWTSLNAAEVGISAMLKKGSRLMKPNHDAVAAALNKLESSTDDVFVKHLDKAAEHFGKTRIKAKAEPKSEKAETHHPAPAEATGSNLVGLTEEEHRTMRAENDRRLEAAEVEVNELKDERLRLIEAAEANGSGKVEVTVKIGLDEKTLALLTKLLPS